MLIITKFFVAKMSDEYIFWMTQKKQLIKLLFQKMVDGTHSLSSVAIITEALCINKGFNKHVQFFCLQMEKKELREEEWHAWGGDLAAKQGCQCFFHKTHLFILDNIFLKKNHSFLICYRKK